MKLQWAEHQIKAAQGFLESITSTKKNLKQLGSVKNASASAEWLKSLLGAVQACEKASNALRSEKWVAKDQLSNTGSILSALIVARKAFHTRVKAFRPNTVFETEFDRERNVIHALGQETPSWMQRLAEDALSYVAH